MFTGIVEEIGVIQKIQKGVKSSALSIQGNIIFGDLNIGDSIAVNGVCLTVANFSKNIFIADVMHETLNRSTLNNIKNGNHVNLERAMPASGRFGGHIVSGHIDGIGMIANIKKDDNTIWYTIKTTPKIMDYIIEKGSIAIDGISLTVADAGTEAFSVSIIPHTAKATILSEKSVGDSVNLENDVVGKYIGKLIGFEQLNKDDYTLIFLSNCKHSYMQSHIEQFHLDNYFSAFYCTEDFDLKPKYEIFNTIKQNYNGEFIIIGDRFQDMEIAQMHDLKAIGCSYGYGEKWELSNSTAVATQVSDIVHC